MGAVQPSEGFITAWFTFDSVRRIAQEKRKTKKRTGENYETPDRSTTIDLTSVSDFVCVDCSLLADHAQRRFLHRYRRSHYQLWRQDSARCRESHADHLHSIQSVVDSFYLHQQRHHQSHAEALCLFRDHTRQLQRGLRQRYVG